MSIKEYKRSFSGIKPSKELHDSLVDAVLKEEQGMRKVNQRKFFVPRLAAACTAVMILGGSMTVAAAAIIWILETEPSSFDRIANTLNH